MPPAAKSYKERGGTRSRRSREVSAAPAAVATGPGATISLTKSIAKPYGAGREPRQKYPGLLKALRELERGELLEVMRSAKAWIRIKEVFRKEYPEEFQRFEWLQFENEKGQTAYYVRHKEVEE